MGRVGVLDTGVLVGMVFAHDQHHDECLEYVRGINGPVYITPCVGNEFSEKSKVIPKELKDEVRAHRKQIIRKYNKDELNVSDIVKIQQQMLSTKDKSHRFLFQYYDEKKGGDNIKLRELTNDLSDMVMEIGKDACQEYGGFKSLITPWTKGCDSYPTVETNLLVKEGDDKQVCIEAHHVATKEQGDTELATANPKHFIRRVGDEPVSRKENILDVTNLFDVKDTSQSNYP